MTQATTIQFFRYSMNIELVKFATTSLIQLSLSVLAAIISWQIFKRQNVNQKHETKIKLYDKRVSCYYAFRDFVEHCCVNDFYGDDYYDEFKSKTNDVAFLFGKEVYEYKREIIANAVAVKCLIKQIPCSEIPVVGSVLGFFPGSSTYDNVPELQDWFILQHKVNLFKFFQPYLDYGLAGIVQSEIKMKPKILPEPKYLIRTNRPYRPNARNKERRKG